MPHEPLPPLYVLSACPCCKSGRSAVVMTAPDYLLGIPWTFYVSKCSGCGFLFQNPRLRKDFLPQYYPDEYGPYSQETMRLGPAALWHLKQCKGYMHLQQSAPGWGRRWLGGWAS